MVVPVSLQFYSIESYAEALLVALFSGWGGGLIVSAGVYPRFELKPRFVDLQPLPGIHEQFHGIFAKCQNIVD